MDSGDLRNKLMDVYHEIENEALYLNRLDPFVVYCREGDSVKKLSYTAPSFLGVATAITPGGSILYIGSPGDGKTSLSQTLGIMLGGMKEEDIEIATLRMDPEKTRFESINNFDPGKLNKGEKDYVTWTKWTQSPFKIVDELNRAPPGVLNLFMSGLGSSAWKYGDEFFFCPDQRTYATMNPHGAGTFEEDAAMYDRFVISCEVTPIGTLDGGEISRRENRELQRKKMKQIMTWDEIKEATIQANEIDFAADAELQTSYLRQDVNLCVKAGDSTTTAGSKTKIKGKAIDGLCTNCHYNNDSKYVCNRFDDTIGGRSHQHWGNISKSVAYLLGFEEVTMEVIGALVPFVFHHRTVPNENILNKSPYNGQRSRFMKDAWNISISKSASRAEYEKTVLKLMDGEGSSGDRLRLRQTDDLLVNYDFFESTAGMDHQSYKDSVALICKANSIAVLDKVESSIKEVIPSLPLAAQEGIRDHIRSKRRELG